MSQGGIFITFVTIYYLSLPFTFSLSKKFSTSEAGLLLVIFGLLLGTVPYGDIDLLSSFRLSIEELFESGLNKQDIEFVLPKRDYRV